MDDPREGFDDHKEDVQDQSASGFAEYGIDNVGRQGPGCADDPDVSVEPIIGSLVDQDDRLASWLQDPAFQNSLLAQIGPPDLEADGFGRGRYLRCCEVIAGIILKHF